MSNEDSSLNPDDQVLQTLKRTRASYTGQLTNFDSYFKLLQHDSLAPDSVGELQLRTSKLECLYAKYDEVQLKIECLDANFDGQLAERSKFEDIYYTLLSQAHSILALYQKHQSHDDENCSRNSDKTTVVDKPRLVKLPTIKLPQFDGSFDRWLEFRDTFSSLIHTVNDIDDINKFHYLRACLQGSAAVVIQAIEVSANNYAVAWKLLCERYDNKRMLIQNHVSALFNLETIAKESSVTLKRIIDQINKNLRALDMLGEPVKQWDTLLIYIITQKLDQKTFREWEDHKSRQDKDKSITFDMLVSFLRNRADLLETLESTRNNSMSGQSNSAIKASPKLKTMFSLQGTDNVGALQPSSSAIATCPKCSGKHKLSNCSQFLALSNEARLQLLPKLKICFNCFSSSHYANHCKKPGCKLCKRKHNVLVHVVEYNQHIPSMTVAVPPEGNNSHNASDDTNNTAHNSNFNNYNASADISNNARSSNLALSACVTPDVRNEVLLSTAIVKLCDSQNREHKVRALLDSGSTSCIISEKLSRLLSLPLNYVDRCIMGINNISSHIGKMCRVSMKSLNDSFQTDLNCFILPSITDKVPSRHVDLSDVIFPCDILLADPGFHVPSSIDLIIGADVFWDILGSLRFELGEGKPILQETKLGWIVSGPINCMNDNERSLNCNLAIDGIQDQLSRFWQVEEVNPKLPDYSSEEKLCEEHFVKNTTRLDDGRFCVKIPLKQSPDLLGDSRQRAQYCLLALERRLQKLPKLRQMYRDFLSEYESLGHMSICDKNESVSNGYFIPHHGVLREDRVTTKLRVVFNASSPTTSGISSNNIQMVGPRVQDDLLSIYLRFRTYKYVIAADVEKMYRQITVHPDDRYLQQILWRDDPSQDIKVYQLNTVTYGTASAPFLATRCLKQVGLECKDSKISDVIIHDFYVDDLLTGGDDLSQVIDIRERVTAELASACMPLRKWKSNEPQLASELITTSVDLNIGAVQPCKTLGLGWITHCDELYFPIGTVSSYENTKRDMLSIISQVFDPLGLVAPCVINMKMMLQKLWLDKMSWDEKLSEEVSKIWAEVIKNLPVLKELRIPRLVVCDSYVSMELHIFADASERAYGACVYVRSVNDKGDVTVHLLLAKSRVAPLKPMTIPRLELCGALVAARLYEKVIKSFRCTIKRAVFWSDSMIVLGWLNMLPNKLQPFVRNRVAEILETTGCCIWRHVPTDMNPADFISRGVDVKLIHNLDLWWSGPDFLSREEYLWPQSPSTLNSLPELKKEVVLLTVNDNVDESINNKELIQFNRFSNILRLKRAVAYALRFIKICKKQSVLNSILSNDELNDAMILLIKTSQRESFPEYSMLLKKQPLPKSSNLLKFNVFLDSNNIMRVGGRLDNSSFDYDKKHPMLLQSTHFFTKLLFRYEHIRLLHAGPQLLLASIRETFWPIGGRNLSKNTFHQCVKCSRMKGQVISPLMGNLPQQRLQSGGYPFESVGVDYAGPILSASRQGRGCKLVKVYIAVFVCFTTKAIHLELVGDLTSNNYLLALRRFISRRGKPVHLYSDNGTSFVGAYNELSKFLKSSCNALIEAGTKDGINFHFIPAYSPHFGGLWEAGVKSVKTHLQKVLGMSKLTFEELSTTLVEIEAVLNSRPLSPLSSDPNDYTPLTPGHFLIGRPITAMPQKSFDDKDLNNLSRFARIEKLRQHFWRRWSLEYVAELQDRTKWRVNKDSLKQNALVIVKEENLPPLKWKLGRIVGVHSGADGIARVADIRTSTGVIRRSFSKICPLPC